MSEAYFIMFDPGAYDFMNVVDGNDYTSPLELVSYLTNRDVRQLTQENYLDYLLFDRKKLRAEWGKAFGIQTGAAAYIGNQIARLAPDAKVIHADASTTTIREIIELEGGAPAAVFMTAMSTTYPVVALTAIVLNYAKIPVVLGGIHISTTPQDVDMFIRKYCPHPSLIVHVRGPGDSQVIGEVLGDLGRGELKREYTGRVTVEDGVWGSPPNVQLLPPVCLNVRGKVPIVGRILDKKVRVNSVAPFLGCPYSCSYCAISTLREDQRKLTRRTPDDILDELAWYEEVDSRIPFSVVFFVTDNLLMGGKVFDEVLEGIVERKMNIHFVAQISIEVADKEDLLERMRHAGALFFEIGLESLDLRNLEFISKHAVHEIKKSGLSVQEYYARQIRKIQDHGIAIQGSFMFGLPYDRFDSLKSNTGLEAAQFCIDNHISLQSGCFSATPGARAFADSVEAGTWLYGKPESMDYFRALSICDHGEMNTRPPEGLRESRLLAGVIALQALQKVGQMGPSLRIAAHSGRKAFSAPTARGRDSYARRVQDAFFAFGNQLVTTGLYREHGERLASSRAGFPGALERLYNLEESSEVRAICENYVSRFC